MGLAEVDTLPTTVAVVRDTVPRTVVRVAVEKLKLEYHDTENLLRPYTPSHYTVDLVALFVVTEG